VRGSERGKIGMLAFDYAIIFETALLIATAIAAIRRCVGGSGRGDKFA